MILVTTSSFAQHKGSAKDQVAVGIGLGLPYGGIGGKVSFNPADQFAFFGGLGYNFLGVGFNGGLLYSIPIHAQIEPYITGMYGYNAVINVKDVPIYQRSFAGPSFGVGVKINSLRYEGAYWDVSLLIPSRSQAYKDSWDELKRNPYIEVRSEPWPILFSFGFNIPISVSKGW